MFFGTTIALFAKKKYDNLSIGQIIGSHMPTLQLQKDVTSFHGKTPPFMGIRRPRTAFHTAVS
jgi:hypothetical protein